MKQILAFLLLVFLTTSIIEAQDSKTNNHVDENGLKQGFWEKHYSNGTLQYSGNFVNDKPIGKLKRYNNAGVLKAEMIYIKNSNKVYSWFFYPNKEIHSKGIYKNKLKDSVWNYYSMDGVKINKVNYKLDKKDGSEKKFYKNGNISEISEWSNGINNGLTIRYYESGKVMSRLYYSDGILNGEYNIFNSNESIKIQGKYKNNKREGKWIYYKDNGHIESEINYTNGIADNQEELDRLERNQLEELENNKGKIKDPSETMYNAIPPNM